MVGTRRFELIEGSSSKFWEVKVEDATFTVTYGRIGTAGTSKATKCASAAQAQAEADKLVREKTKKGYQELGAVEQTWRKPPHFDTGDHPERFLNYKVSGFDPEADGEEGDEGELRSFPKLRDLDKRAFRIGIGYDDSDGEFPERLEALLADPKVGQLRALLIGNWFSEVCEDPPDLDPIIEGAAKLGSLKGLFVGDVTQEEHEISWLHQGDYTPLLTALPNLEELVIRGGNGLRFTKLSHPRLRVLVVQTGGLARETTADIVDAKLPELRQLTLWLGVDEYGGTTTVADLAPLLSGDRFPKLEHLGLQNSTDMDAIATAVARSPLLERLKGLDLSMGTLSDAGGEALLAAPAIKKLKHLNLRHHYLSQDLMKRFKGLGIEVDLGDRQEGEGDNRYAEVTE